MRRYSIHFFMTIIIAVLLSTILPWWSVMIAGFISGFTIPLKKASIFFIPFLAVFIVWVIHAGILSNANDFILAKKIAVLLPLGGSAFVLILVTGIIGGVSTGITGIFGNLCSTLIKSSK